MKNRNWIALILSMLLLMAGQQGHLYAAEDRLKDRLLGAREGPWQITAERMSHMQKEGLYVAEGNVVITREGQILTSQRAIYNEKSGIVQVTGDVRLEVNGDILTGEKGIFDLNNHTGQMTKGHLFLKDNHFYVSGDVMEKTGETTYLVRHCRLTTCDGPTPDWSITGSEVKVTMEGYGTVKDAAFRIRDFPVFYTPYGVFPVKTKRQSGLLPPRLGYSNRNGMDMELPFFWAISDQMDATLYERVMGKRGYMQGLEYRYVAENDSKGVFLFDILSDRVQEKDMSNADEAEMSPFPRTNGTRYWLRSMTDQQLPYGITARLDTDVVSDQDYMKEFGGGQFGFEARPGLPGKFGRPMDEIYSATRRSALRLARDGQGYSLQGLSAYYQRPENPAPDDTSQPLGGLNFSLLPRPLPYTPLFLKLNTDYGHIWRDEGQKGHRFSLAPTLSYPMWVAPYLEFEPSVSFTRLTQWVDGPVENPNQESKDSGDFQARVSTLLERIFDFEFGDVKKIKHKLVPSLVYQYRDYREKEGYRPWFEKIYTLEDRNRVTLLLDNLLDARKENAEGQVSYTQLSTFTLAQGYNLQEARREEEPLGRKQTFEPLVGIFTLDPFPCLQFDAEAHWDYYDHDVTYTDLSLELSVNRSGGLKDSYGIDYQFKEGENENLNYRMDIHLLYGFSAGTSFRRDLQFKYDLERSYWLRYESQCWAVKFAAGSLDGINSVMVTFSLKGIGEI
ncbi:MAG: LPS assembly protein LptD [Pseudomonadota bacterium]